MSPRYPLTGQQGNQLYENEAATFCITLRLQHARPDRLDHQLSARLGLELDKKSAAWLTHKGPRISLADVQHVVPGVRRILEDDFYDSRFRHLTPRECAYVLAMADLGPGSHSAGEIAARFGVESKVASSIRNSLIRKDVIYSPGNGLAEFRIPLTERYIAEHRPDLERRSQESTFQRRR